MECVLYGVGSPFVENVLESLRRLGWAIRGGVENVRTEYRSRNLAPIVGLDAIPADWLGLPVILPLTTPGHRWSLEREALQRGFRSFATVLDPTAVVSSTARIGEGSIVTASVTVGGEATLGRSTCLNAGTLVGHHAEIGDYASTGPGAVLCGYARLERGAFVGAGAVVGPKVTIGANAVVGLGAAVRRDVPEHTVVAGNPAVTIQERIAGYNGVSVGESADSGPA